MWRCSLCGQRQHTRRTPNLRGSKIGQRKTCGPCGELLVRMSEAHAGDRAGPELPEHDERVARYAAIVQGGGRIFE